MARTRSRCPLRLSDIQGPEIYIRSPAAVTSPSAPDHLVSPSANQPASFVSLCVSFAMSARSSTSSTFLIPALFSASSAAQERDVEAQSALGFEHIQLPSPPAAVTRTSRARCSLEDCSSATDDFFGVASPSFIPQGTQDSRHDAVSPPARTGDTPPPPYSHSPEPPAYTRHAEHPTLVKHLFKFGFRE